MFPHGLYDSPVKYLNHTVKTKKGLPLGTQFKNTAAIYFDFNEAVITNTTVNTLGELSVEDAMKADEGNISIYPKPNP